MAGGQGGRGSEVHSSGPRDSETGPRTGNALGGLEQLANVAVIVGVGAAALALGTLRFARKDTGV